MADRLPSQRIPSGLLALAAATLWSCSFILDFDSLGKTGVDGGSAGLPDASTGLPDASTGLPDASTGLPDATVGPPDACAPNCVSGQCGGDDGCGGVCQDCSSLPKVVPSSTSCQSHVCHFSCAVGFADLDGKPENGCEATLPTGVPEATNLVLWLAGDSGWNGSTWADKSGSGRDATYYTGTVNTAQLNGRTVIDLSAGGQLLVNAGFGDWSGVSVLIVANTSTDDSIIAMGVSYNPSCDDTADGVGAPGCVAYDQLAFGTALDLQMCDPSIGSCYQTSGTTALLNQWVRLEGIETPGVTPSFQAFFNGVESASVAFNIPGAYPAPWSTPRKDTVIGWRSYRGQIAEIIVFNTAISEASRGALDSYLKAKWNLP